MSIRLIAKDLYRCRQEVEKLENRLKCAPGEQIDALKDRLRRAKAELKRMQGVLEGSKDSEKGNVRRF